MKILITGAGGFLGSKIVKHLCQSPQFSSSQLYHCSRSYYEKLSSYPVIQKRGDLNDPSSLKGLLDGIDVVIHTASRTDQWGRWADFYGTNVEGTNLLLEESLKAGVKIFLYTSSPSVVFSSHSLRGLNEDYPYPPSSSYLSHYAHSKALAEKNVLSYHRRPHHRGFLKTMALRPHLIWGADDPHFYPRLKERLEQKKFFQIGQGKNLVDVIYVENAAWAHVQALTSLLEEEKKERENNHDGGIGGQAYFLGQERPVYLWEFLKKLIDLYQLPMWSSSRPVMPAWLAYTCASLMETKHRLFQQYNQWPLLTKFMVKQLTCDHYFSHERAKQSWGYEPPLSLEQSYKHMSEELRESHHSSHESFLVEK